MACCNNNECAVCKCTHPKRKVERKIASYSNEEYFFFQCWVYHCTACGTDSRYIAGAPCIDSFEYELFTGRRFDVDFAREIKAEALSEARRKVRDGQKVIRDLSKKRRVKKGKR